MKIIVCFLLILINYSVFSRELKQFDKFWAVLTTVESSNNPKAIGDGGKAIGIAQIHKIYWQDSGIPGEYEQCFDINYSKRVVYAYLLKYSKTDNFEEWARIHNGGPTGNKKQSTINYWRKFKKIFLTLNNK